MAVQAQYPSPAFRVRNCVVFEEFQQHHNNQGGQQHVFNGTVFSEPESELTCNNVSGTRKRSRDDHLHHSSLPTHHDHELRFPKLPKTQIGEKRVNMLEATSTSGRWNAQDIHSQLFYQDREIDALVLMQNEKLRLGLEEAQKIHWRSLLSILESKVLRRLEEKETELANARRRNAELEEKLKQMNADNQIWFNVAKNNEAIASTLKSSLEQILLQNQGQLKEGFGDSDSVADDAQSCSSSSMAAEKMIGENIELKGRKYCKVCKENEVSVLLLTCRHLCLCKNCESKIDSCPICKSLKTASLQIFLS